MVAAAPAPRVLNRAVLSKRALPEPGGNADKEARGHVLVVAGSHEMPGAAILTSVAALRADAGKLTIAAPQRVAPGLALGVPESRVIGLPELTAGGVLQAGCKALSPLAPGVAAVVVGPGMLDELRSTRFVRGPMLCFSKSVFVLDALAMSAARAGRFEQPVIMTPHAGEMAHLTGLSKAEVSAAPLETARSAAKQWNACVVLKGATTFIALPDGAAYRFDGGTSGLATSGSGDTLAGLIGGLAARGAEPLHAAAWGVMLHAQAGHSLRRRLGPLGFLAREQSAEVPSLLAKLARSSPHRSVGNRAQR
jgi:hydroxyethylthiazole kinase-like uncharacterized protein yjeF